MIKYFKTTKQYIRIDTDNVDATLLFIDNDKKLKSNFIDTNSYQNLLSEITQQDSPWIEIDETTYNDILIQIN